MNDCGERVRIEARKLFWRRRKLRVEGEMTREDGSHGIETAAVRLLKQLLTGTVP